MKKALQSLLSFMIMLWLTTSAFAAPMNNLDWENANITVRGMGATPAKSINMDQGRMMARRAAIVDAYRLLAETIKGVNVDSESTVENMIISSDITKTKVNAVIHGAQILNEHEISGGYEVTMTVPMFGISNSLASAVMPNQVQREMFPPPVLSVSPSLPTYDANTSVDARIESAGTTNSAQNNDIIGGYTGLIIDCRNLGLKPVMSPVIKNANNESIYGHKNLDPNYVIAHGMVSYTSDIKNGTTRAGNNPLVIKAISLENHNSNPVISVADANRVLIENQAAGFLEKTNVVFLW